MLKRLGNYLQGYLKIRISGYSPERFLNLCKHKEIEMWGLEAKSNTYEMYMTVKGFRKLKPILRKTRTRITILERHGVPFFFFKYRKRNLFFCGSILFVVLIFILSRFIWNIDVTGNRTITDEVVIEYLETTGVFHGMKRSDVNCEKIDTGIRKNFNEIIWVSASLEGCNIIIQVKENTDTFQVSQAEANPTDIIASAEGKIVEMITRSGKPCVKEGDQVKAGDLLVSGTIEVMNDAGEVVREDYKAADADVYAEVIIPYEDVCETVYREKIYNNQRHKYVYLNLFGYHIGIGIKKNETKNYEMISDETQLKINQNFKLPISFGKSYGKGYELQKREHTKDEKEAILNHNFELYCKELEERDIEILEKNIQLTEAANGLKMSGYLKVKQSIKAVRKSVDF